MKKYIDENFIIITTDSVVKKIKDICPNARVVSLSPKTEWVDDELGINKYLIDKYLMGYKFVEMLKNNPNNVIVEWNATNAALEKLSVELQSNHNEPTITYKPINEMGTTLNEMELVFKMGQLAIEIQENERKSYELDTPYYELGNIVKQAYKDMYKAYKGYYHE